MASLRTGVLPLVMCDEPFTHLLFACLLLSKVLNNECFKKESQNGSFPKIQNKRGSATVIGSTRGPQKVAPLQHPCLNCGLSQGWVGFSLLSFPLGQERVPVPISVFPRGRCYKAFVHYFRCEDTSLSALIPIILFSLHGLGPA